MMTADGRQHFAVANHGGQDALAHPRMAPDNAIFLRRQPGRLVQDGVGYADLADVVQHGGQAEMLALAAVQTEGGGEMQGEATHAPGVAGRVRIAFLDRAHQAGDSGQESAAHTPSLSPHGPLQRALRALVVLMAMIASPGGLQDVAQFVELDGLEEIVVRAGVETFAGGVRIVAGRQDDDADVGPAPADFLNQPQTAPAGHEQIGHDDGRVVVFEQFEGLFGGAGRLTLVVPGTGGANENVLRRRFVIDHGHGDGGRCLVEPYHVLTAVASAPSCDRAERLPPFGERDRIVEPDYKITPRPLASAKSLKPFRRARRRASISARRPIPERDAAVRSVRPSAAVLSASFGLGGPRP